MRNEMKPVYYVFLLLLLTACSGVTSVTPAGSPTLATHSLSISHHQSAPIEQAQVDAILASMNSVLVAQDESHDFSCNVGFNQTGTPNAFSFGTGIVNSAEDFDFLILGVAGEVKVVNMINYCGGFGSFLGCAPKPGEAMVVVRTSNSLEGVLWAHEFGHNQDLSHNITASNALMNPQIGRTTRTIDSLECDHFSNYHDPSEGS